MNARIARAADFGRSYALLGAFAACLLGAWTIPPDARPRGAISAREPAAVIPVANRRAPASHPALAVEQAGVDMPLPVAPPSFELAIALPPAVELVIAELPMAELPPFDPTIAELGVTVVDGTAPANETRPLHGRLSHAIGPLRRQVTPMQVAGANELTQVFQAHDYTLDQ